MNWQKVKSAVARVAPVLGSAINPLVGGPVGAMIAAALGTEESPDAIEAAIIGNPDAALKLKELQDRNIENLERLSLDRLATELADTQNARMNHKMSRMPAVICVVLTLIVAVSLGFILYFPVPESNSDLVHYMFGQVTALWGASVTYWVGTTRSSAEKTRLMR
jgi:hypothetical protein